MKLTIRNLGRLESATIDLDKKFLLFVGRNNTSKTYAAYTIYGLYKHVGDALRASVDVSLDKQHLVVVRAGRWEIDVVQFVEAHLKAVLKDIAGYILQELAAVFAADASFTDATAMDLFPPSEEFGRRLLDETVGSSLKLADGGGYRVHKMRGYAIVVVDEIPPIQQGNTLNLRVGVELVAAMVGISQLLQKVLLPGSLAPFALSAERSAIQLFSRELSLKRTDLVDALLDKAEKAPQEALDLVQGAARRYPLVIRDGLRTANDLANLRTQVSPLAPLADRLETQLGGVIVVDETGEMMFRPQGASASLRLHLSSSSVKSLAGLVFYLRHLAQPGGSLFIDEPELNLHPDNQRHVARILAAVVRAGVRVLVTTHSDYFVRELNNLILLHRQDAGPLREKYDYDESETLAPEDLGAYLFTETTAQPIEVQRAGIEVKPIDEEINKLNRISQDLFFSLVEPDSSE